MRVRLSMIQTRICPEPMLNLPTSPGTHVLRHPTKLCSKTRQHETHNNAAFTPFLEKPDLRTYTRVFIIWDFYYMEFLPYPPTTLPLYPTTPSPTHSLRTGWWRRGGERGAWGGGGGGGGGPPPPPPPARRPPPPPPPPARPPPHPRAATTQWRAGGGNGVRDG